MPIIEQVVVSFHEFERTPKAFRSFAVPAWGLCYRELCSSQVRPTRPEESARPNSTCSARLPRLPSNATSTTPAGATVTSPNTFPPDGCD